MPKSLLPPNNSDGNAPAGSLLTRGEDFRKALRAWFLRERRDLPWRRERSVYRTVVSEFMLQQTQVDAVIPYFENWMRRWKDFAALAEADEASVLRAWEGLGYYSRARNLLAAAQKIVADRRVPATLDAWRKFRGIGAYTAAAIVSIAQGVPAAVVDGNVVRILSRLSGTDAVFRDGSAAVDYFSPLAETLLNRDFPGDHNEAMMELGAIVCSRRSPRCLFCPVKSFCAARSRGIEETLPRFVPKTTKKICVDRLWCRKDDTILLARNTAGTRRLKNLCEFPRVADFSFPAEKYVRGNPLFVGRRGIASEQITERFFAVPEKDFSSLAKYFVGEKSEIFETAISSAESLTFSGPHRKWFREILKISLDSASGK